MSFKHRTNGRWREILLHYGAERDLLNGKHQSCPQCGGKDRWRFDNKRGDGDWICSHCGNGDGGDLLMVLKGWDFRTMAEKVEEIVGTLKAEKPRVQTSDAVRRARLSRLWEESQRVDRGDPVSLWLQNRVGNILVPSCLRYHPNLFYAADPPTYHPAMIAKVDGPDGRSETIHRTYLTMEGRKAPVEKTRLLMPGSYAPGSAVRLFEPMGGRLAVAEGIETALAVFKTFALPVWSLINTSNMQAFTPPDHVTELFIFADHDPGFAGQAAAYTLAKRLVEKIKVHVILPEQQGDDWNDVFTRKRSACHTIQALKEASRLT